MIETERLRLRAFVMADAPRVAEICGDYRVASMCRVVPYPYTEECAAEFIDIICAAADVQIRAIETHDGLLIGCVGLEEFREADDGAVATLGYWLAVDQWGHGYATEAASALIEDAYESRGLATVLSGYWTENTASARVQEKLGFRYVRREKSLRCAARGCDLEQICTRLYLPARFRADAEHTETAKTNAASCSPPDPGKLDRRAAATAASQPPPVVVLQLLTDAEVLEIQRYARQLHAEEDNGWTQYGQAHEALFLHHGGLMHDDCWRTFPQACPQLCASLLSRVGKAAYDAGMCRAAAFEELHVRCIEHHTCEGKHRPLDSTKFDHTHPLLPRLPAARCCQMEPEVDSRIRGTATRARPSPSLYCCRIPRTPTAESSPPLTAMVW